jgi:hypothetical protein
VTRRTILDDLPPGVLEKMQRRAFEKGALTMMFVIIAFYAFKRDLEGRTATRGVTS